MRKLYSMKVELRVLRTIVEEPESRAAKAFLAKLDTEHFASEVARAAWKRIRHSLKKSSSIPSWDELSSDPNIDESIQEVLEDCDFEPISSKKRTHSAIDRLQEYRKLRTLTKIGKQLETALNSTEPVNVDEEIEKIQSTLSTARQKGNFKVLRIGQNSNVMKSVERMLKGTSITYVPTGFNGFDSINRGIPDGAYMLIAAPTGSGKSALLSQMCENMSMAGAKVGTAPLEMSNDELLQRNMARVGTLDMTKLLDPQNRLSKRDRKELREKMRKYDKKIASSGGSLEYYEFEEGITVEQLCATVEPYELDVLGIDYLGLLDGMGGDNMWRALMDAGRYLHVWGKATKTRTIAAAQLSEDGALRYSKGLAEHAKFFWYWTPDEISKQTGIYEITQRKARQASDHSFMLHFNMPTMTIKDASQDAIKEASKLRNDGKKARGDQDKTEKKWKKESKIGWEDEDDEDLPKPVNNKNKPPKGSGKKRTAPRKEIEL